MPVRPTLIVLLALASLAPARAAQPAAGDKPRTIFNDRPAPPPANPPQPQSQTTPPPPTPTEPAPPPPVADAPAPATAPAPAPPPKSPVPAPDELRAATRAATDTFKDDLARAREPADAQAVVEKILDVGIAERAPAARYALLALARDTAAQAGDLQQACDCVDLIDGVFVIDAPRMKADAAALAVRAARTPETRAAFLATATELTDAVIAAERFDLARRLADLSLTAARGAGDAETVRRAADQVRRARESEAAAADARRAAATLATHPTDPRASAVVGRYACLVKGDWATGLPHLARATGPADAPLAALAKAELAAAADSPDASLKIADDWWNFAEKEKGPAQERLREHARDWYRKALPGLQGLTKARAEKRLEDPAAAAATRPATAVAATDTPVTDTPVTVRFKFGETQLGTLVEGERYLTNRAYVITQLPEPMKGLTFTRRPGGGGAPVEFDVPAGTTVFVLAEKFAGPLHRTLLDTGWQKAAEIAVSDRKLGHMFVFGKVFRAREGVTLLPQGFVGVMIATKQVEIAK
jgi:hypothetical protein